jgi:preprotein translocase subunit YajC
LEKGDEVVTQGGIHGKIVGLTEQMVILEVDQGVKIRVDRASIGRRKGKEEKKEKEKEEKKEK